MLTLLNAINNQRISQLRESLVPMNATNAVDVLSHIVQSSMTHYTISIFVAEVLYWCEDTQIYAQNNRSKYPKVLYQALEIAGERASDSLKIKLKAVGQKVRRLKELLKTESNPNKKDTTGNSAMHYAVELGLNSVVKGFLIIGGDMNLLNRQEDTPCHIAARLGRRVLLEEILFGRSMEERIDWEKQGQKLDALLQSEWGNARWILLMFRRLNKPLAQGLVWTEFMDEPLLIEEAIRVDYCGRIVWAPKDSCEKCPCCSKIVYQGELIGSIACQACMEDEIKEIKDEVSGKNIPLRFAKRTREGIVTHQDTSVECKVRGYHCRPCLNFFKLPGEPNAKRFYGFELELVLENQKRVILASTCIDVRAGNELYMNADSSIRAHDENGETFGSLGSSFELISHPMTLGYIKESKKLDEAFYVLQDARARSLQNSSTGLHVHISREGYKNNEHMMRFHTFFYAPHNAGFIEHMAGRARNGYQNSRQSTPPSNFLGGTRYEMLNYNNSNTVEVRLFKGAVGKDWLVEKVEFLDCLIEFCETDIALMVEEFEAFAYKQGAYEGEGKKRKFVYTYPQLISFFEIKKAKQKSIPFLYVA